MDSENQNMLNLILHDYSTPGDYHFTLTPFSESMVCEQENVSTAVSEEYLNGYGLYSIFVDPQLEHQQFKIYVEKTDVAGDNRIVVVNSADESRSSYRKNNLEYFSEYQSGFLFYRGMDGHTIRIVLETGGCCYASAPVKLSYQQEDRESRKSDEQELVDMVQQIYAEQPLLLLSVFQKSPLCVYIGEDSRIRESIDTELALMERCIQVYHKQYSAIRRSLKFKLQSHSYMDRLDKLTGLTADTMSYIAQNPQYLVEVKRKKGIRYNGNVYLPEKTIVTKNVVDYGTYENCYILSFLKMLIHECEKLKLHLRIAEEDAVRRRERARLKSQKADFDTLVQKYQGQLRMVCKHGKNVKRLFSMYQTAFQIGKNKSISSNISKPRVTAVFKQIPEYNIFYRDAFAPWFDYGIKISDNMTPDTCETFVTAVSNPSTTYELYIVCMWIKYLMEAGYTFSDRQAKYAGIHEKESRYSDHAYEFVFTKEDDASTEAEEPEEITLYYSPSVYLPVFDGENNRVIMNENNVDAFLYRNTRNSIVSREDQETNGIGAHYEPDFILKYQKGNVVRYIMADAKHKDYETVRKTDMPQLLYKYIDSIKTLKAEGVDARIAGLCAVYHQHCYDAVGNQIDTVDYFEYNQDPEEDPFTKMLYMNIEDDACNWEETFADMLIFMKQYKIRQDDLPKI